MVVTPSLIAKCLFAVLLSSRHIQVYELLSNKSTHFFPRSLPFYFLERNEKWHMLAHLAQDVPCRKTCTHKCTRSHVSEIVMITPWSGIVTHAQALGGSGRSLHPTWAHPTGAGVEQQRHHRPILPRCILFCTPTHPPTHLSIPHTV